MRWSVEVIFENGVLKPMGPVPLHERERAWVTVDSQNGSNAEGNDESMKKLMEAFRASPLRWGGKMPSRDELHEL